MLRALVLNADYSFINITTSFNAFCLIYDQKADLLKAYDDKFYNSQYLKIPVPAIIVMKRYVKTNRKSRVTSASTRNIILRDKFVCAYCGKSVTLKTGTKDHIVPQSKSGKTVLSNLITACRPCNSRKDDKSLAESGMKLLYQPRELSTSERLSCLVKTCSSRERSTWIDWLKENNITLW